MKPFYAHFDPETGRYQSNHEHLAGTAEKAQARSCVGLSPALVRLTALLHDCGKYSEEWAAYFAASVAGKRVRKLDHATAGGILAQRLLRDSEAAEFVSTAIFSHHGLRDSYVFDDDAFLPDSRREKASSLPVDECAERLLESFGREELEALAAEAKSGFQALLAHIRRFVAANGESHGDRYFLLGMYERLLTSILIDADRRDTEDFMAGAREDDAFGDRDALWRACAAHLEQKLASLDGSGAINVCRREISALCREAGKRDANRFLLSVPTGAGKTLSALRFALAAAEQRGKKRIIYVAPYLSITEQNAKEIRDAVGRNDIVLEHHATIVPEDADEEARYDRLTEDWRVPIVVTTAVQFLNTLFSARTSCVRRLGSLCDSIIIVDEVQALPVKITELFCAAVNFWSELEGAVFVLCSATQPCLERIRQNSLLGTVRMVDGEKFQKPFTRTELHDETDVLLHADTAAEYIVNKANAHGDVLFIANTKRCAEELYRSVCALCGDAFPVYYLSTNLYPAHRRSILESLKTNTGKPRICISTQVVEAGVNLSFRCVIRSLAGLDSILQAAGRCNRNGEFAVGHVYIVRMDRETENLAHLPDIGAAREAMLFVLDQYRRYGTPGERLDDGKYIDLYFGEYYRRRRGELSYPVQAFAISTSIVEMLSANTDLCRQKKNHLLCQSFATAGNAFEVIEDDGKFSVVVETEASLPLLSAYEDPATGIRQKKQLLRRLASYTVAIPDRLRREIADGIRMTADGAVLVLDRRYYDGSTGVTDTPALMEEQII